MKIGIFARVFERPSVEAVLDAVVSHGIQDIQFNMSCAGLPGMPVSVPDGVVTRIRQALDERAINVASLSGTYNMIHPDPTMREAGLKSLQVLAEVAKPLGTDLLTLCTGTRDAGYMWRNHPDNATPEAWADLRDSLEQALGGLDDQELLLFFFDLALPAIDRASQRGDVDAGRQASLDQLLGQVAGRHTQ